MNTRIKNYIKIGLHAVCISILSVPLTLWAPSGAGNQGSETKSLQELRAIIEFARFPVIAGVTIGDKNLGRGLGITWDKIPEIIIRTRMLVTAIKDIVPTIKKTLITVKSSLDALKAEDLKEKTVNNQGINTIRALGYGIDALQSTLPLFTEISSENGLLEETSIWMDRLSYFIGTIEVENPANENKKEMGDQLKELSTTLGTLQIGLRTQIIPQITKVLPEATKMFETMFGKI